MKKVIITVALAALVASCSSSDDVFVGPQAPRTITAPELDPSPNVALEDELLAMFNDVRGGLGNQALERDPGHDYLIHAYTLDLAVEQTLGARQAEELAREHAAWDRLSCTEITQWWGGAPSAKVHYDAVMAAGGGGRIGDESYRWIGLSVVEGRGPAGSQYESNEGSYLGLLLCNHPFRLVTDPAAD